jgi:predicted ATP-dependent serine protease
MDLNYTEVEFTRIKDVEIPQEFYNRLTTNVQHLDDIFGGGIFPGSTATLISDPGVGKSIFSLQLAEYLTKNNYRVAYSSGEEDISQIAFNAARLNVEELKIGTITDVDKLTAAMANLDFIVIDSFQCLKTKHDLNSKELVKYISNTMIKQAKYVKCSLLFIVQLTTSGDMRGGTLLPYAVDTNIRISKDDDNEDQRIINVYKNRFGKTGKHVGMMTEQGYDFAGVYVEPEKTKTVRVSINEQRKDQILGMVDHPFITVNRIVNDLNIGLQTANNLLRELTALGKIEKVGRGSSAVWISERLTKQEFLLKSLDSLAQQYQDV